MKKLMLTMILCCMALLYAQIAIPPEIGDGSESNPYQIAIWQNLYWISQNSISWDKHFIQTTDIDFAEATPAINTWDEGAGWTPIGIDFENSFTGKYNGNNKTISGLLINRPSAILQGFFGHADTGAEITNLELIDVNVTGYNGTGGLVGGAFGGSIADCYSTGDVTGEFNTGGLVGFNYDGPITNCCSIGSVTGGNSTGGLVGGSNYGTITNCYSTESVTGDEKTGGLVGYSNDTITNCYSTGNVTGEDYTGGLVGISWTPISNCYSTGNITGEDYTGGLVGISWDPISNCYSTGSVTGDDHTGGLVGENHGTIENCFWDIETSGQSTSDGGTGLTTAEMKTESTFTNAGWSFPDVWEINPDLNDGYPYLNYPNSVPNEDVTIETPPLTEAVLHSAYPNPFNPAGAGRSPSTTISFYLVKSETVKIEIYNIKGQIVKNLVNKAYDKGTHSLVWDGKDDKGTNCGTGAYFYRMTAGKTTQTKKMMMIK